MHRQADHLACGLLRIREIRHLHLIEHGLSVQTHWVVHGGRDTGFVERALELGAHWSPDRVLGVGRGIARFDMRWRDGSVRLFADEPGIGCRDLLAALDFVREDIELGEQDGGLKRVEPPVHADPGVVVAPPPDRARGSRACAGPGCRRS